MFNFAALWLIKSQIGDFFERSKKSCEERNIAVFIAPIELKGLLFWDLLLQIPHIRFGTDILNTSMSVALSDVRIEIKSLTKTVRTLGVPSVTLNISNINAMGGDSGLEKKIDLLIPSHDEDNSNHHSGGLNEDNRAVSEDHSSHLAIHLTKPLYKMLLENPLKLVDAFDIVFNKVISGKSTIFAKDIAITSTNIKIHQPNSLRSSLTSTKAESQPEDYNNSSNAIVEGLTNFRVGLIDTRELFADSTNQEIVQDFASNISAQGTIESKVITMNGADFLQKSAEKFYIASQCCQVKFNHYSSLSAAKLPRRRISPVSPQSKQAEKMQNGKGNKDGKNNDENEKEYRTLHTSLSIEGYPKIIDLLVHVYHKIGNSQSKRIDPKAVKLFKFAVKNILADGHNSSVNLEVEQFSDFTTKINGYEISKVLGMLGIDAGNITSYFDKAEKI